jgi:hypothetical protein
MGSVTSAAGMKGAYLRGRHLDAPREGTKIRQVYDLFFPPLTIVPLRMIRELLGKQSNSARGALEYLCNFYGLDLRERGHGLWWLVGEYSEGEYRDYFAEQAERENLI